MSLSTLSLQQDATGATITGGTAISLTPDCVQVSNGIHVADMAESNFIIRTNATFKARNPQILADGTYSKAKRSGSIVKPKILADGSVAFNLVRFEVEAHPETTDAELTNLHMLGSQVFSSPDTQAFLKNGSLS